MSESIDINYYSNKEYGEIIDILLMSRFASTRVSCPNIKSFLRIFLEKYSNEFKTDEIDEFGIIQNIDNNYCPLYSYKEDKTKKKENYKRKYYY